MDEYRRNEARRPDNIDIFDKNKPRGVPHGFYDQLIYLTSASRDKPASSLSRGEISWNIPNVNYSMPLTDCVELSLGVMSIPLTFDPLALHRQFINDKVYVEIIQLPVTVGYRTPNGNRFHFECSVEYVGEERAVLTPISGPVYLRKPLQLLDNVTLRFYQGVTDGTASIRVIPLYEDFIDASVVPGTNPAQFTTTDPLAIGPTGTVFAPPNLEVYVSQFSTGDATFDSDAAPSNRGLRVSTVSVADVITIIGLDATTVAPGNLSGNIFIPKNNISVYLKCTCVLAETENYITPVHI